MDILKPKDFKAACLLLSDLEDMFRAMSDQIDDLDRRNNTLRNEILDLKGQLRDKSPD